jgi:hypothetical protein
VGRCVALRDAVGSKVGRRNVGFKVGFKLGLSDVGFKLGLSDVGFKLGLSDAGFKDGRRVDTYTVRLGRALGYSATASFESIAGEDMEGLKNVATAKINASSTSGGVL